MLEPYAGASEYDQHGRRVVEGQRLMQAASDIFLGWDRVTGLDGNERDFYVRQLWDWKVSADVERMTPTGLAAYGRSAAGRSRAPTRAAATASRSRPISAPARSSTARSPASPWRTRTRTSATTRRWRRRRATAGRGRARCMRLVPALELAAALRSALASWRHRGRDRGHGADRAEEPRLRGHRRGASRERAVRGRRRRHHLRALLHLAAHLDGPQLVARGRRRWRGGASPASAASRRRELVAAITLVTGLLFLLLALLRMGWIAQLPLEGGGHRLPGGRRRRRRDRRAAEADRDVRGGRQRLARARVVARLARRRPLDDVARRGLSRSR